MNYDVFVFMYWNIVFCFVPSMVRRKMASPPFMKSLLLALGWVRYTAVPKGGPR